MSISGPIWGLDLAVRTGVAIAAPGEPVQSRSIDLKKSNDHRAVAFTTLQKFLNQEFRARRPALIVKESMFALGAFQAKGSGEAVVRMHAGLHAIVEAMCGWFEVPWRDVADSTVRKHFIGAARTGSRETTKAAVVARCHLLNLLPHDCTDDNRADAIAVHDWACATFASKSAQMSRLYLFDEQPGEVA